MSTIEMNRSVGELVAEKPGRSRVFEAFGIDFCCGGKIPLEDACARRHVSVEKVVQRLLEMDSDSPASNELDFASMELDALADHIVEAHHVPLKKELPRLNALALKVARVHGDRDARLVELAEVVNALVTELTQHMMKEEQILFPAVRRMVQGDQSVLMACGNLSGPVSVMESEHDDAGEALSKIKELTDEYTPPDDACNSWRALFDGLRELELDMHLHIHKENNILFPKALEMER